MSDKLKMDELNSLPAPLFAHLCGRDRWPIFDIEVEIAMVRIDVCGLLEIKSFAEVFTVEDGNGTLHDAEQFWVDYVADEGTGR